VNPSIPENAARKPVPLAVAAVLALPLAAPLAFAQGEVITLTGTAYRTRAAGVHTVSLRGYSQFQNAQFGLA